MSVYLQHFGLAEPPFGLTPDTGFLFARSAHSQALATLQLALADGDGFVLVCGEVGTGKTLLCRALLDALQSTERACAYLPNPMVTPRQLLRALCLELALPAEERASAGELQTRLERALLARAESGQAVVLCIDDAQAMPCETLETLRLLSNLESAKRKLLQVVLFGQPELQSLLAMPALRSLASRIGHAVHLAPLTAEETRRYLQHRLIVAGWRGAPVFSRGAMALWHWAASGVPRRLNVMAHKALMLAYGAGRHQVGWRDAWLAWRDSRLPAPGLRTGATPQGAW
jgi:MSHA biogenesis protein MshM